MTDKPVDDRTEQVAVQCKAVAHLAGSIAELYDDLQKVFAAGGGAEIVNQVGKRTAGLLEALGEILNATDSMTEDDDWVEPVMERARQLWPGPPA